jgi:hypothetical protein
MPMTKRKRKPSGAEAAKNGRKGEKASSARAVKSGKRAVKKTAQASKREPRATASRAASPAKDKRQLAQERKILRSQSRWLQKALFALDKAEDDQAKLAEVRGEKHEPMAVRLDGTTHDVGDVTDALRDSVMDRLEGLRRAFREEHALLG